MWHIMHIFINKRVDFKMNFFYDLLVNYNDAKPYEFYEWEKSDNIIHLKKIPVFKISSSDLNHFLKNDIIINQNFLETIHNKTESYNSKNKYNYMSLFTDEKNSIIIEFSSDGKSLYKSKMLLEEELDLLEIAYSLKKEKIEYILGEKNNYNQDLRQIQNVKRLLLTEIKTLKEQNNIYKLRYLFKEITNEDEDNKKVIVEKLISIIKSDFNENHLKLYNIIKLSYNNLSH